MSNEALRRYINESISAAETKAKSDCSNLSEEFNLYHHRNAERLRPLVAALKIVDAEISAKGVEIAIEPSGTNATVTFNGRGGKCHLLSFHSSYPDCEDYRVFEEKFSIGMSDEMFHRFATTEEVLAFVLSCIGKHIAEENFEIHPPTTANDA